MGNKSRNILLCATSYLPLVGGAELALKNITDRLPDFSFDLVTSRPSKDMAPKERIGNVEILRVGGESMMTRFLVPKAFFPIAGFLALISLLKQKKYGAVIALQASQAAGAVWLLKLFGINMPPFILMIQEGKDLERQSWLTRFFRYLILRSANHVVVISKYLEEKVHQIVPSVPITLIPNGVDMQIFKPDLNDDRQNQRPVVITVSRLVEKNGVGDLVEAIGILKKTHGKNIDLIIVGDGPLRTELEHSIQRLDLSGQVSITGVLSHELLPARLTSADIFVRASHSEGLGTAFLEAMACGLPVIGTSVGGIPDFLHDGETGLMCRTKDPADIAEKINLLLEDESLKQRISTNGMNLVREHYTWDIVAGRFKNLLHAI